MCISGDVSPETLDKLQEIQRENTDKCIQAAKSIADADRRAAQTKLHLENAGDECKKVSVAVAKQCAIIETNKAINEAIESNDKHNDFTIFGLEDWVQGLHTMLQDLQRPPLQIRGIVRKEFSK